MRALVLLIFTILVAACVSADTPPLGCPIPLPQVVCEDAGTCPVCDPPPDPCIHVGDDCSRAGVYDGVTEVCPGDVKLAVECATVLETHANGAVTACCITHVYPAGSGGAGGSGGGGGSGGAAGGSGGKGGVVGGGGA